MKILFAAFAACLLLNVGSVFGQDEEMNSPAGNYSDGATIDTVMEEAAMEALMDQLLELLNKPADIANYLAHDEPEQGSVRMEGDMLFTAEQYVNMEFLKDGEDPNAKRRKKRKAIKHNRYRWPNNNVPYSFRSGHFSGRDIQVIRGAMNEWARETCLSFSETAATTRSQMVFQNGGGCSSYVGRIGTQQPVTLAPGCRTHGIVVHEVGHAMGFQHEQTRPDRDQFVTIHQNNIIPSTLFNFQRYTWGSVTSENVPYDYLSVMHYGPFAFSRNRQPTISVKDNRYRGKIGNRRGLSFRDIKLANLIYNCASRCNPRPKCPGEGFVDKNCRCRCPGNPIQNCNSVGTVVTTQTTRGSTASTRTPPPTGNCQDISSWCVHWARGSGCRIHYPSMSKNCRKTCNLCSVSTCRDKNRNCPAWQQRGYCNNRLYVNYMNRNCEKSCNKCRTQNIITGPGGKCDDIDPKCEEKSTQGKCESDQSYMQKNCVYTCNFC